MQSEDIPNSSYIEVWLLLHMGCAVELTHQAHPHLPSQLPRTTNSTDPVREEGAREK